MYGRTSSAPTMFDHPMIDINQADGRLSSTASLTLHYPTSGILLMYNTESACSYCKRGEAKLSARITIFLHHQLARDHALLRKIV